MKLQIQTIIVVLQLFINSSVKTFYNNDYQKDLFSKKQRICKIFPNIRNLREDNDKKQQELVDYLNVKQTTYSKYELGKINIPIEVFIKLADYYNMSIDYIVGRTSEKK